MNNYKVAFKDKDEARRFLRHWKGKNISLWENTVTVKGVKDSLQVPDLLNKLEISATVEVV